MAETSQMSASAAARPVPASVVLMLAVAVATLGGAFVFQYGFGLAPCKLCLWQRWPWAAAIGLGILALVWSGARGRPVVAIGGMIMVASAGLGLYHTGIEQMWWSGPQDCTGAGPALGASVDDFLARLNQVSIVRCDEIPWSLFGISLAGFNFLISAALALVLLRDLARRGVRGEHAA